MVNCTSTSGEIASGGRAQLMTDQPPVDVARQPGRVPGVVPPDMDDRRRPHAESVVQMRG
jgi:hypothetical protein